MSDEKPDRPLRRGWTTGTCATAAATAAYEALLTGTFPEAVTVLLPRGGTATLPLARTEHAEGLASAGVIKDAGDDPDVTHGAEVIATVAIGPSGTGVTFQAGEGVGVVTLPGLPVPVGEPAINPGPRQMIREALTTVADHCGVQADVVVTVSIPGGDVLAEKTLNGRLGIRGGLSVLGTTGVVVPFSCAAWVHSIHRGIDVARASGIDHVAATTGSTSEAGVQRLYGLPDQALIDMGDFVGGTLKYMRTHPLPRLSVGGGFAKMVKLAQGNLFLHSSKSRVDMNRLADDLAALGASAAAVKEARGGNTAAQVLSIAGAEGLPLADVVARGALSVTRATLNGECDVEVLVFDRAGRLIGRAGTVTDAG